MDGSYIAKILEEANLEKCRPALIPGTDTLKRQVESEEELNKEDHATYRKIVGQLLWLTPVQPDIAYGVKELSRGVSRPTLERLAKLRH